MKQKIAEKKRGRYWDLRGNSPSGIERSWELLQFNYQPCGHRGVDRARARSSV